MSSSTPITEDITAAAPAAVVLRHLRQQYATNVDAYRRGGKACRRRMTAIAVHRLRTTIRRLLACLEVLGAAHRRRPSVSALLQAQLEALGSLRNTQVQLQRIQAQRHKGRRAARVLKPLRRHLEKREQRRGKAARHLLKSRRALHRLQQWKWPVAPDPALATARIHRLVADRLSRTVAPLAALSPRRATNVAIRHQLRIASRNFRFMLEALPASCRGGAMGRLLARLRSQMKAVGGMHDREQLLHRVDRLIASGKLQPAALRPFCQLLRSEKTALLQRCAALDRQVCSGAQPARRHLRKMLLAA